MATRTIVRMFDDRNQALRALHALEAAGFTQDEVSLMASNQTTGGTTSGASAADSDDTSSGAGTGATIGTVLGGGAGILAGIGAMAIPGIGPIVAAGWLVAALTGAGAGAAAGGLLGSLAGSGVEEADAHVYAEGVRRGGTLVTVRGSESRVDEAERILSSHPAVDVSARSADWRAAGWSGTASSDNDRLTDMDGERTGTMRTPGTTTHATTQATPRADDDGRIIPRQPDGAPGNPPGTEVSRGVDKTLGTNISGAHPENDRRR